MSRDAEWCGQCFTRLDRPAEAERDGPLAAGEGERASSDSGAAVEPATPPRAPAAAVPSSGPTAPTPLGSGTGRLGVRAIEGNRVVWDCPACGRENDLDIDPCPTCGTPFGRVWQEPEPPARVSRDRAMALSLLFPGIGHVAAGRVADGTARAVVFSFTIGMVAAILTAGGSLGGPLVPLVALFVGASATLYLATAVDARRAVAKEPPVLTTRMLLIGGAVLLIVALLVLLIGGAGAG